MLFPFTDGLTACVSCIGAACERQGGPLLRVLDKPEPKPETLRTKFGEVNVFQIPM